MLNKLGYFIKPNQIKLFRRSGENNKNFWDVLWPYLVEKISKKTPVLVSKNCFTDYYMTIWSILANSNCHALVWWSWIISKDQKFKKPKKVFSVRWPKTRDRLLEMWIDCPEIYWDPALLISRFYQAKTEKTYELWIIAHYVDNDFISEKFKDKNVKIINLLDPIEKVIDDIYSCKRTISSSLHWIIVSHSYGIPCMWVEFSKKLYWDWVKFEDYFSSVNIKPYKWYDYSENIPEIWDIIRYIDTNHNDKINIDLDKLLNACPFKN